MACCGKGLKIPADQQKIINEVNKQNQDKLRIARPVVKSNRTPAGTMAKQCPVCGTKTIVNICPICSYKFI